MRSQPVFLETYFRDGYRRSLMWFSLLALTFYLVAGIYQWMSGRAWLAAICALTVLGLAGSLAALAARQSATVLAGSIAVWSAAGGVCLSVVATGGGSMGALVQAPAVLLCAFLFTPGRTRVAVTSLLAATATFALIWPKTGWPVLEPMPQAATIKFSQVITPAMLLLVWIGMRTYAVATATVLSRLEAEAEALRQSKQTIELERARADDLVALSVDGYWETGIDGRLTITSPVLASLLGRRTQDLLGTTPWDLYQQLVPGADTAQAQAVRRRMLAGEPLTNQQLGIVDRSGQRRLLIVNGRAWRGAGGMFGGYRGTLRDETERARHLSHIERLSNTDPLTGLLNRRAYEARLQATIDSAAASPTEVWIAYIDLDGFKRVNDADGHAAGDRILIGFAQCLTETSGPEAAIARMGGDEFSVLLPSLSEEQVSAWAQSVIGAFDTSIPPTRSNLRVTASIGLVPKPTDLLVADAWLQAADETAYEAKRSGGNRYLLRRMT